jgi:CheY-like chemotaxis protein
MRLKTTGYLQSHQRVSMPFISQPQATIYARIEDAGSVSQPLKITCPQDICALGYRLQCEAHLMAPAAASANPRIGFAGRVIRAILFPTMTKIDTTATRKAMRVLVHDARDALAPLLMGIEILRNRGISEDQTAILDMMSNQVATLSGILNLRADGDFAPSDKDEQEDANLQPLHETTARPKPESILIVDDNPNIIAFLQTLFEDRDYTVFAAIKAEDAVALAAQFKPDLCLCDIGLPTVDGYYAASDLLQAHPDMRLFSMSGLDDLHDQEQSLAAGFRAHFKKPIPFDEMIRTIEDSEI